MAIKFLQNIDLGQNQLLHARVHVASSAPAGSGKGSIWLNSSTNELNFHNGTGFVSVMDDTNTNQLTTFTLTADSGTNQTISKITGLSEDSIKNQTQPNKDFPKWLKYTIDVFERMSDGKKK